MGRESSPLRTTPLDSLSALGSPSARSCLLYFTLAWCLVQQYIASEVTRRMRGSTSGIAYSARRAIHDEGEMLASDTRIIHRGLQGPAVGSIYYGLNYTWYMTEYA